MITAPETNREKIALLSKQRQEENDAFREFLLNKDGEAIDEMVHQLNDIVSPRIDCTTCGACCNILMINVTPAEIEAVSARLQMGTKQFKEKYIEESMQGQMVINRIPCHFLKGSMCSIYENRFAECRRFPHLERNNFKDRLFGTLIHYAMCPIIFNVVEELKIETGFKVMS